MRGESRERGDERRETRGERSWVGWSVGGLDVSLMMAMERVFVGPEKGSSAGREMSGRESELVAGG
jgi:hypothetical protein